MADLTRELRCIYLCPGLAKRLDVVVHGKDSGGHFSYACVREYILAGPVRGSIQKGIPLEQGSVAAAVRGRRFEEVCHAAYRPKSSAGCCMPSQLVG
jgi:hypothetical protein